MNSLARFSLLALAAHSLAANAPAAITGQWDFNNTTDPLAATVGQPLQYVDPTANTPGQTQVATTTALGVPDIASTPATVMHFGLHGLNEGYYAPHGIAANGEGGSVNKWTIIMDVLFPAESALKWRALIQTDPFNIPDDDAEMYINETDGVGINSVYHGNVPPNTWVRLAFVGDLAAENGVVRTYINGLRIGEHQAQLDSRFALSPDFNVALFTDGYADGIYTQPGYINSLQIHDTALSDGYIAALGAPAAEGIPTEIQVTPFARIFSPASGPNASPEQNFLATIENGVTSLATNSIRLTLNGEQVTPILTVEGETTTVAFTNDVLLPRASTNTWVLIFSDNATPAAFVTNSVEFVVADYQTVNLPAPIHFENFESTPEGELPAGWTSVTLSEVLNVEEDLGNLDSGTYARWTVVEADRFKGTFVSYSDPNQVITDYQRVLNYAPNFVVSNKVVKEFAAGKFAFANSGYRNGMSQVLELYTPDFNLSGHAAVHLAFHSIWEQNQDSIAGVEYSTDQGATWKPVIYMIDDSDIARLDDTILAVATLTAEHDDVARYFDNDGIEQGGTYAAFIKAPITEELGSFISGRTDDDSRGSKRIEVFPLPDASDKSTVRFRFFHAGTDSWYFGIDNFGLYSLAPVEPPGALQVTRTGETITITWEGPGRLEKTASLSNQDWKVVTPTSPNVAVEPTTGSAAFYRVAETITP